MQLNEFYLYDNACYQMTKIPGIRFAGIINKHGRKIAGGFSDKIIPLETDEKKIEMLMMELTLDLSMRKEFDNTLGNIKAIVSYRDKANIITIPHNDKLLLVSAEPELDPLKVIQIAHNTLVPREILEVKTN